MNKENSIYVPKTICFRVSRKCNTYCPFCQAPPNNCENMTLEEIKKIINLLAEAGMNSIKFTGGEPFVRKDILEIISFCRRVGMLPVVCTNGIDISEKAIEVLSYTQAKVKVSLHGMPKYHNDFTNSTNGEGIVENINRMTAAAICVSLHTIIYRDNIDCMDDLLDFCVDNQIFKVSFIALIERGRNKNSQKLGVPVNDIEAMVADKKRKYKNLDLRVLNFSNPYYVVEPDKKIYIERDNEEKDCLLCNNILSGNIKIICQE